MWHGSFNGAPLFELDQVDMMSLLKIKSVLFRQNHNASVGFTSCTVYDTDCPLTLDLSLFINEERGEASGGASEEGSLSQDG